MQNNGLAGAATAYSAGTTNLPLIGGYGSALGQALARDYPTYGIGLQVTLPSVIRIAEADLARDELQVKQSQIRVQQLQNPGQPRSGGCADRHAPLARFLGSRRPGAQVPAGIARSRSKPASRLAPPPLSSSSSTKACWRRRVPPRSPQELLRQGPRALDRATGSILEAHNISVDARGQGASQIRPVTWRTHSCAALVACRVETLPDTVGAWRAGRRHECRRGTHECVRHIGTSRLFPNEP